jgi:enoyl-CoA hydratase
VQRELVEVMQKFDADPAIGAMVLTGSEKAFAAGADIVRCSQKPISTCITKTFSQALRR